ncbi:MAG TPA: glycosyltransferase family A protein [Draconibacterium sp.]|nr:glycosyltransferase family A protein [Draconibacterium sp.]
MLSISIPVFNIKIDNLVLALHQQAEKLNIPFEIRVYDDNSKATVKQHNRRLKEIKNVVYVELEENVGRAAIRNKMGFDSRFEWLLFIDADSRINHENYLENYIKSQQNNLVVCGGTSYSDEKPYDQNLLRWKYGTVRESISADLRNKQKGFIITSNNFMIEKNVFKKIHFREEIREYGHEDTLLGYDLFKNEIKIVHIDNPLEHTGLEDAVTFLEKSKSALINLLFISEKMFADTEEFNVQIPFLYRYKKITRFISPFFFRFFFKLFGAVLEKNLKGKHPSLFLFDVYKVFYYSTIKKP